MVVIDTSAIVAIMKGEPERDPYLDFLGKTGDACMSAGTLLECGIVVGSNVGDEGLKTMQELFQQLSLQIISVDASQSRLGYQAFRRYGRGSGHPAQLNFGDCFAYALAKTRNLPLLFKGEDFIHTDIVPALGPA
jgi:ribonuclease VapC